MKYKYLPAITFLILFLYLANFSGDLAVSVVPGWHTSIFTYHFFVLIAILLCLLLNAIIYWRRARKDKHIRPWIFYLHLIFSLPAVIITRQPAIQNTAIDENAYISMAISAVSYFLFFGMQMVFIYLLMRYGNEKPKEDLIDEINEKQ